MHSFFTGVGSIKESEDANNRRRHLTHPSFECSGCVRVSLNELSNRHIQHDSTHMLQVLKNIPFHFSPTTARNMPLFSINVAHVKKQKILIERHVP